jgi:hypothetical protein
MADFPTEAKYMRVKNYNDKVLARHTTRISPFNGSIFGPTSIDRILFNIPSETGMEIDMDTLMLHFSARIKVSAPAGTYHATFCNSIESVIGNLRIRKGSSFLLEDIQRYAYLESMFMNYLSKDYNDCVGQAVLGIGPYYTRMQSVVASAAADAGFTTSRKYCVPFRLSGISNYSGLISTSMIDSVSAFQIEIELAPANDACQINLAVNPETANTGNPPTTATYEISSCYLTYDVVRMAPEYHQQLQSSIQRGIPLQIPYKTWRTSMYSLPAGQQTLHVFNINDTVKSLNSVFIAFFKQREQSTFLVPGKDRKHKPPTLVDAQLQLGSFYYPLQPMDCEGNAPQAFLELQKALGLTHVRSEYTGPFGFDGQQFIGNNLNSRQNLETGITATVPAQGADAADSVSGTNLIYFTDNGIQANGVVVTGTKPAKNAGSGANTQVTGGVFVNANHSQILVSATAQTATWSGRQNFYQQTCQGPASEFLIGFNLRKVLDAVEGEIVGTDIQSSGSGLMSLRLNFNAPIDATDGPYNIIVASLYDAVLEIQSNQQTFRVE